jgi:hypothetical protein
MRQRHQREKAHGNERLRSGQPGALNAGGLPYYLGTPLFSVVRLVRGKTVLLRYGRVCGNSATPTML